ncbi:MAG: GNAT family N-acetyltransferase [Pseudomonadota bacterium]
MSTCQHRVPTRLSDGELLAARLDLGYLRAADGALLATNEWERRPPPLLHVVRRAPSDGAPIDWACRHDVPEAQRVAVAEVLGAWQQHADRLGDELIAVLRPSGASRYWGGPAARLKTMTAEAAALAPLFRVLPACESLLQPLLADWVPDLEHRHPMLAVVVEGRAVAVCATVRDAHGLHEAGVETAPEWRRRGCGVIAVAAWVQAVLAGGARPLYTTTWDNRASLAVARRCGFVPFAEDLCVG